MPTSALDRRTFLAGMLTTASLAAHGPAAAQTPRLSANTYQGLWEEAHRKFLLPAFRRASGIDATITPMLSIDAVARIVAARNLPPFDVLLNDEGPFLASIAQDIYETIDPKLITNLKDIPSKFVDASGKGIYVSAQIIGLTYNPEKIRTPPKSWDDLLDPAYKGRVGITGPGSSVGIAWMVETAKLHGGSEKNIDPFFTQLRKLMPNVGAVAGNPGQLTSLFQQGQIDIGFSYLNLVSPLQARGVPVAMAKPDSGWVLLRNCLSIVKNARSVPLAHTYLDTYLGTEVQSGMAGEPYFLAPTNRNVPFGAGLQVVGKTMEDLERSVVMDWPTINEQRASWIERFNRETKA